MPTEIQQKLTVAVADAGFAASFGNLDSLADGAAAWSDAITTLTEANVTRVWYQLKTGGSGIQDGGSIEFYLGGRDSGGTIESASEVITNTSSTTTDAALISRMKKMLPLVHVQSVGSDVDVIYDGFFDLYDLGPDVTLVVVNETNVAFNGTSSPHKVRYEGYAYESQ